MVLALIKNNVIENVIVAESEEFGVNYPDYVVKRIDNLETAFGIGDTFNGETFAKAEIVTNE